MFGDLGEIVFRLLMFAIAFVSMNGSYSSRTPRRGMEVRSGVFVNMDIEGKLMFVESRVECVDGLGRIRRFCEQARYCNEYSIEDNNRKFLREWG